MTNILRQILPNHQEVMKLHLAIENKPFLQRYIGKSSSELTARDHYRHLTQLQFIYDVFRIIMTNSGFTPTVPESLQALLQRGDHIAKDLEFMRLYKDFDQQCDEILPATMQYAEHLVHIKNNSELVTHFLVSILGDLNGGQFLKGCVQKLYQRNAFFNPEQPNNGVQFYCFEKGTIANLTEWLKTFITFHDPKIEFDLYEESAEVLGKGAVDAFTMQAAIVDELEKTRSPSLAKNASSFFNANSSWIVPAAAAAGMTIAVGIMTALR